MPPRLVSLAIVALWLAATAWLVRRDIWPRIAPGEPPPFHVYSLEGGHTATRWKVVRSEGQTDKTEEYTLTTTVEHPGGAVELKATLGPRKPGLAPTRLFRLSRLTTSYLVSPRADPVRRMLAFKAHVETSTPLGLLEGDVQGDVKDQVCTLHWEKRVTGSDSKGDLEIPVSTQVGLVFLPLHPLELIKGLSAGQEWSVPVFDPLTGVGAVASSPTVGWVNARVREDWEPLSWKDRNHSCRVIDLDGESVRGAIWVDAQERVLRMEVRLGGDRWEIVRE